jgi:hypothetical protein
MINQTSRKHPGVLLAELTGKGRDERVLPLLADQLHSPDEALRSWAVTGLKELATSQAPVAL